MVVLDMKNVITERCCGNCEWSISPENEHDIMIENNYEEDDPTRPRAGDCCLGMEHNGDYVCHHHEYLSGGLETYAFYDDKDKLPGYYVVNTYYDHILRYFKLYRMGDYGNYSYGIRVCDLYSVDKEYVKGTSFEIGKCDNKLLYRAITIFAKVLDKNVMWDIEKKSFMTANVYENSTFLYFTGSNDNKFIDIRIDNINERDYKIITSLFRNMAVVTSNKSDEVISKKIRRIKK